jgi:hypothetical protein
VELRASNASRAFLMDSFQTVEKIARRRDKPHIEDINNKIVKFYFDTDAHIHTAEYYAAHIGQNDSEVTDTDSRYFSFDCRPVLFTTNGCVYICCICSSSSCLLPLAVVCYLCHRLSPSAPVTHRTAPYRAVPRRWYCAAQTFACWQLLGPRKWRRPPTQTSAHQLLRQANSNPLPAAYSV